jgi:GT2 family glycosyltransferase
MAKEKWSVMEETTVSIIIITRNRPFLLRHCLQRVTALAYPYKEIIVVDSSTNDESQLLLSQFPEVTRIRLPGQRNNMPQARNEGITNSTGHIIAFIDDDSMIRPEWLSALLAAYHDEQVGAVGGRVIRRPEPYCDQHSGDPQLSVQPSGVVIAKDIDLPGKGRIEVDHLIGCNMSFRRRALEQVGGFDVNYTLTNLREETDLCIRVKKAGWRVIYDPSMAVVHLSARAQAFFGDFPGVQYSNGRNSAYFATKHYGLNIRTCIGQCTDTGKSIQRASLLSGLVISGVFAQLVGRAVGLGMGIAWMLSSKRRFAAAPKIGKCASSLTRSEESNILNDSAREDQSPRLAAKYTRKKDV